MSLRADEQVPQLRKRQLLPVVFHGMHDPELEVRQAAAFSLAYMGPQGALLLIEGLQHDVSPSLRAACAFGLSTPLLSARTARVLLLALRDVHPDVRSIASLLSQPVDCS